MTLSSEDQLFERLAQKIVPQSKLRRTWPLQGGISAEMTALEIERPDGQTQQFIVRRPGEDTYRRNPQAAETEFNLLQQTHSLGLATPTPCLLDTSGTILPAPYLVIEYIEGKPEFAPTYLADYLVQSAIQLAQIHQIDSAKLNTSFLSQPPGGCPETSDDRAEHPDTSADTDFDTERIRETLQSLSPLPQRNASVLLHGDYWPGNLLWREEKLVAVIDWEDAHIGDPLRDLSISRLDMLCLFGIEALHAFTYHYQSQSAADVTDLPYWDLCAALRLIRLAGSDFAGWAAFFTPFGRPDITEKTLRDHIRYFITQFFRR